MPRQRTLVLALVLIVGLAAPARAQSTASQGNWVGNRVRVTFDADGSRLVGVLVESTPESLRVAASTGDVTVVPRASIRTLEVRTARKNNLLRGAAIGAALGIVVGLVTKLDSSFESRGQQVAYATIAYGVPGVLIGAFVKSDRWSVVSPSASVPALSSKPLGLSLKLRF